MKKAANPKQGFIITCGIIVGTKLSRRTDSAAKRNYGEIALPFAKQPTVLLPPYHTDTSDSMGTHRNCQENFCFFAMKGKLRSLCSGSVQWVQRNVYY